MNNISRRKFINVSAMGLGSLIIPISPYVFAKDDQEPHFFIQVTLNGGVDHTYFFDARNLEMTKAKKLQNYLGTEPEMMTGTNGQSTLVSSIVKPLLEFKNELSVINGVVMAHN